jgi:hypothetical protein
MDDLLISPILLACIFGVIAFLYSSVGLGGGSSYSAIMAISGVNYLVFPSISLTLNLVVTFIGSINFFKQGHGKLKLIVPFLITSIPFAYIGGSITLPKNVFYFILIITLIFVAIRIYIFDSPTVQISLDKRSKIVLSLCIGSILGFVAGSVGIGGGIYLVPLIIIFGLGTEKEAATTGALFIWLNSFSGILARVENFPDISSILPLIFAVIIGGIGGSFLGANKFTPKTMQKILGSVVIIAIIFLSKKVLL